jgi:endoglucanase
VAGGLVVGTSGGRSAIRSAPLTRSSAPIRSAPQIRSLSASCAGARLTGTAPSRPRPGSTGPIGRPGTIEIRINQVGYVSDCEKVALVMSSVRLGAAGFSVVAASGRSVRRGRLGPSRGAWSRAWPYVYPADFSALTRAGHYAVEVDGARSPVFRVGSGSALYGGPAQRAVDFFAAQRDGPDVIAGPLDRKPAHLLDQHATVYAQPSYSRTRLTAALRPTGTTVDASGGWFDAGDYLKFVETASFSEILQLLTLRDHAGAVPGASLRSEAEFGVQWLLKMWDAGNRVLYYQVGIGDGNGSSVLGDHDLWRLPQADDRLGSKAGSPAYFVSHRPVFAANSPGGPISPNLAGRMGAALGLCAEDFAASDRALAGQCLAAGEPIYGLADTQPNGELLTTSPHAYYPQTEWTGDMELGAVELYLGIQALDGTSGPGLDQYTYLDDAGEWANQDISSSANGSDSLNLYDVSALAEYDLFGILSTPAVQQAEAHVKAVDVPTDPAALLKDLSDQLGLARRIGLPDPFRLSNTSSNVDTVSHALGYAIEARLYDLLLGRPADEQFAETELGWVLGANAWGSSFVVGAGSTFPDCLADEVANLSGSLDGRGPLLLGATVDGPNAPSSVTGTSAPDGYRRCPQAGGDRFAAFDGHSMAYVDNVTAYTTSEPSDDLAALALLAFAQQAELK